MARTFGRLSMIAAFLVLYGCGSGGGGGGGSTSDAVQAPLTVGAAMREMAPAVDDTLSPTLDLGRLGVTALDEVYELETPVNTPFAFTVTTRRGGNAGAARLSVAHAAAGGQTPSGGAETLGNEGFILDGAGLDYQGTWLDAGGDGFARLTLRGQIARDEALVVKAEGPNGPFAIGVRIRIGQPSVINVIPEFRPELPGVTSTAVYSSDSYQCGLPAIAVSGDRYSVAAYDGIRTDPFAPDRKRVWLQLDSSNGSVTGGEAHSVSPDSGSWRDQELAARGNVLAVAFTGNGQVRMDVSLDRGATFPIQAVFDEAQQGAFGQRLVQAAIAEDYTLACLYWRSVGTATEPVSQLVLVEGTPNAFDANNTPTGYTFSAAEVVHDAGLDVTPLVMSIAYSQGGDTVVGYGYTFFTPGPSAQERRFEATYRCAVRLLAGTFVDKELDHDARVMPMDPSVSVLGSGANLNIFYAYEKDDGVHVLHSANAGLTFSQAAVQGPPGAMSPSIHARMQGGAIRVDVLYLDMAAGGYELKDLRWNAFGQAGPSVYRLTEATIVPLPPAPGGGTPPFGGPAGGGPPYGGLAPGYKTRSIAWLGFDAVTNGDDVAVAILENTDTSYAYYWMSGFGGIFLPGAAGGVGGGSVGPPVLLPGMTGSVPAPDPGHRSQLRILVID